MPEPTDPATQDTSTRLKESEATYRGIFDSLGEAVYVLDERGTFIDVNRGAERMYGYARDELIGMTPALVSAEGRNDLGRVMELCRLALNGEHQSFEFWGRRKDGGVFPKEVHVYPNTYFGRKVVVAIAQDITERKSAEAGLREAQEMLALFLRHSPIYAFIKAVTPAESRVLLASENFKEMIGIAGSAMAGKTMAELFPPEFAAKITADDWEVASRGTVLRLEEELNGRSYITIKFPLEQGGRTLLAGYTIDVTERREAEEGLRRSERFNRSILDTVDEGFLVIDRDYRILTANKAYCSRLARSCDEVVGQLCHELSHGSATPCFEAGEECAVQKVFATGMPHAALHRHPGPDGQVFFVETKAYPIRDASGAVVSAIETITDVTEKRLLEDERLKTQKLESIGTLAGGIAHDFNNLLQGIFGYIAMAKLTAGEPARSLAMLEQAEQALHQSVSLTTQLLTFSKGGKPVKGLVALPAVIENAARFALSGSRSRHRIVCDPGLWLVEADEGQIAQVLQNIVLNADQAMPLGGSVEIAAYNVPASDERLPPALGRRDHVAISIRDGGAGIPRQLLGKIFDPYFTTKEKGSGLGLATSFSIVRNHDGLIEVRSEPGRGSTFLIYLPATTAAAREEPRTEAAGAGTRHGRILVMDDESLIREVAGAQLAALGHDHACADRGEAAIAAYRAAREAGRPFDVVILDLTIRGGMGGEETVRRLLEIDPGVKAVVSSGYSDDGTQANYRQQGFRAVLKKPYSIDDLRRTLDSLLS